MATPIAPLSVRWRRPSLAETDASDLVSAACYRRPEHVGVHAVIIAELKFRDVERHIFGAHLVERADYAALEDRPETLNRVRVDCADNVLMAAMVNARVRDAGGQVLIAGPSIGRQQADLIGNDLFAEIERSLRRDTLQNTRDDIALAFHRTNNRGLLVAPAFLFVPMAVFVFAPYKRLIHFYDATKLHLRLNERGADFVAHAVRSLVGTEPHLPLNLQRANSFLTCQHQVRDFEPVAQRLVSIFKNRPGNNRKAIAVLCALLALPVPFARRKVIDRRIATTRTHDALRPAAGHQVSLARIIVTQWETRLKIAFGHLRDGFRTFCHGSYPLDLNRRSILP